MSREVISQGKFVWGADAQGSVSDSHMIVRQLIRGEARPSQRRERLNRPTGERALGGVPVNINPDPFRVFLDKQRRNVQS